MDVLQFDCSMGSCLKGGLIVTAILVACLSYYLYTPMPEGISNPGQLRIFMAIFKFFNLIASTGSAIGYKSHVNMSRSLYALIKPSKSPSESDQLLKITDTTFDGIRVRIYRPVDASTPSPAVMFFHGGGWVYGSVHMYDEFTSNVAKSANVVVVSVEYRLAPDYPFPIPFDDCLTATLHLMHNAQKYGVHANKIAVAGDSAGGNLAAAVALYFRDKPSKIALQILIYPCLQAFNFQLPSYMDRDTHLLLQPFQMAQFWAMYLGVDDVDAVATAMLKNTHTSVAMKKTIYADYVNPKILPSKFLKNYSAVGLSEMDTGDDSVWNELGKSLFPFFAPLLAPDLSNSVRALVFTVGFDVLRDEGYLYVDRLEKAGVDVVHRHIPDTTHGALLNKVFGPFMYQALHDITKSLDAAFK